VRSSRFFYRAAKSCIEKHPTLSYVVRDTQTDASFFERVSTIDLEKHIFILEADDDINLVANEKQNFNDLARIETIMPAIADQRWSMDTPPWRLTILPLQAQEVEGTTCTRCFIVFSFSHALGDAISAVAFHRTFREEFYRNEKADHSLLTTPVADFPAPFDTPQTLPISWSFLFRPLIAVLLPKFVANILGLRSTASTLKPDTWTSTNMFFDQERFHTCLKLVELQRSEVEALLQVARQKGTKLTAMVHQSLVRALSKELPRSEGGSFVSGTAVNMRRAVGRSNDEMGLFVNAWYEFHERDDTWSKPWTEQTWENAHVLTEHLAKCAVTLQDQAVGLLRYAPSIKKWTAAKIGQARDSSFEVSNLGAFDLADEKAQASKNSCKITKMVFSHSANVTSSPFTLSIVSVKGGSMVISITWQPGALGVPSDLEQPFIDRLSTFLLEDLRSLT
jgi:hypothetical protein